MISPREFVLRDDATQGLGEANAVGSGPHATSLEPNVIEPMTDEEVITCWAPFVQ